MLVDSKVPRTVILPFYCNKSYLLGNGILKTWLNLGEDGSISTCGTYHGDTIVHNENIEASKVGETRKLKGMWIHPRYKEPVYAMWTRDLLLGLKIGSITRLSFATELPGIVLALHPPFLPDIKLVNHCRVGELNRGGAVVEVNSVKRMQ
ncbi:hypothetical protein RHMOL_Rhmol03G0056100 [Rhododendron molle]|uniref:Uncharacterized protein n=1 Tax=Rhododendron molle TaxID=49168 RepID=A0ACC0PB35_RHOML|nr:hypothetical protein RHMOL_Rhmol03G0056100 [Rhododendron molle]